MNFLNNTFVSAKINLNVFRRSTPSRCFCKEEAKEWKPKKGVTELKLIVANSGSLIKSERAQ